MTAMDETAYHRSSHCGGGSCVEVAFRRSTRCASTTCVEVSVGTVVYVRDSKHPEQAPLIFDREEWADFLAGARDGEFDV